MNCGARAVLDQNMAHPNDKDTDKAKINQNFNRLFDLVTSHSIGFRINEPVEDAWSEK